MNAEADTRYMVGRTLALLLTDLRGGPELGQPVEFVPARAPSASEARRPLLCWLVHALNIWVALRTLRMDVLPLLGDAYAWQHRLDRAGPRADGDHTNVDWDKTLLM